MPFKAGATNTMGNFYTNITLRKVDAGDAANTIQSEGKVAYVAQAGEDCIVYDAESDEQDIAALQDLSELLSKRHRCAALAVINHDEDVFGYFLFDRGDLLDEYLSNPDFFSSGEGGDRGGNPSLLCKLFGKPEAVKQIHQVLYEKEFPMSSHCHRALCDVLGLPSSTVGNGFNHIAANGPPEEFQEWDIRRIG